MGSVKAQLAKLFEVSLRQTVPDEPDVEPLIAPCAANANFGDYQWYGTKIILSIALKGLPSTTYRILN